jgi:hypothetical protein
MDTETAYDWLQVWVGAKHSSFEGCTIDTSKNVHLQMNRVTDQIVQEAITIDDPHVMGVSTVVDAEDEENAEGTSDVDHKSATPYTIHTAVLTKAVTNQYQCPLLNQCHVKNSSTGRYRYQ